MGGTGVEFRLLRADEIDCRISIVNQWGVGLLLYKDARCDQNIMDETVGAMNWQRHHTRENANCIVAIWDAEKSQWVEKEDTGTESFTEKEKGLASDSFKRACFNWGIGRELYTAPNMFFPASKLKKLEPKGTGYTCRDQFRVESIDYDGRSICEVVIEDITSKQIVRFGQAVEAKREQEAVEVKTIGFDKAVALSERCRHDGVNVDALVKYCKVPTLKDLSEKKHANICAHWDQVISMFAKTPENDMNGFKEIPEGVQAELPFV